MHSHRALLTLDVQAVCCFCAFFVPPSKRWQRSIDAATRPFPSPVVNAHPHGMAKCIVTDVARYKTSSLRKETATLVFKKYTIEAGRDGISNGKKSAKMRAGVGNKEKRRGQMG